MFEIRNLRYVSVEEEDEEEGWKIDFGLDIPSFSYVCIFVHEWHVI